MFYFSCLCFSPQQILHGPWRHLLIFETTPDWSLAQNVLGVFSFLLKIVGLGTDVTISLQLSLNPRNRRKELVFRAVTGPTYTGIPPSSLVWSRAKYSGEKRQSAQYISILQGWINALKCWHGAVNYSTHELYVSAVKSKDVLKNFHSGKKYHKLLWHKGVGSVKAL